MAAYNFKREAKVYLVFEDNQYNIDVSELNFSQTIMEKSISSKTIQSQEMFERAVINKANPANFELTFPALQEADLRVMFDRALDYQTFDLYIATDLDVFKLRNCVITNGVFIIEKLRPLSMSISGQASQLSLPGVLSGTPIVRSSDRTYNRVSDLVILLDGSDDLTESLNSIQIELQNNIKWNPWDTLQGVCVANDGRTIMYPETFVVPDRELSGTITCYLTGDNESRLLTWGTNTALNIEVGQDTYGFRFNMSDCFFQNNLNTRDIFTQSYNWRLTENPAALSDLVTYETL